MKAMKGFFIMAAAALSLTAMLPAVAVAQCNDLTLPYSEDFDSYTQTGGATMPTCWTRVVGIHPTSSTATYPNLTTASSHGTVLNFMGQCSENDGTGTMKIATPHIPTPLNSLELSFDVYKSGLTVYLATDPTDQSTYTLVGSYSPGWSWTTYEVRTDTLTGASSNTGYLVFCGTYGNSGYSTAYLDNLTIHALNACQRPEFVRVNSITPYTADLAWPSVTGRQGYRVSYNDTNDLATATFSNEPTNTTTLSGLNPATEYYVWVQTICDGGALSDPRPTTFTTQAACYPLVNLRQVSSNSTSAAFEWSFDGRGNSANGVWVVLHDLTDPYAQDYEDFSSGPTYHFFTNLDPTHDYTASFYTLCDDDSSDAVVVPLVFHHCGESELAPNYRSYSKDFPFNFAYNYSYSQTLYPASVFFDMDTIRGLAVRRDTAGTATTTRRISIWMANSSATTSSSSVSVTGMTHVAHGNHLFKEQEWDTVIFNHPFVYDGYSNVQIVIVDSTGSSVGLSACPAWINHDAEWATYYNFNDNTDYNPASLTSTRNLQKLPDIRFVGICHDNNTCEAPVVAVSYVDTTFADVMWEGGAGTQWVVEYRLAGDASWIVADSTTSGTYTLTSLQPNTHYEVRVGVLCDSGTRYTLPVTFTTSCALMHLPFHFSQNDMVAAATNGFTDCWTFSQYIYRGRLTNSHRGYLRNVDLGQWFMLPAIAEPLSDAKLSTWVECGTPEKFRVGIASENNASDVVWLDTVQLTAGDPNTSHHDYTIYLDNYTGNGNRIVISPIVSNIYSYVYFFDFHVEPIEACRPAINLVLDSASATSLSVSWTPRGSATQWVVFAGNTAVDTVSTPHCTISGLAAYTEYNVSVRPVCNEDELGDALEDTFRTLCEGEQCQFSVVMHSSLGTGSQGAKLQILADSMQIGQIWMLDGSEETHTYSVCADATVSFRWLSGNDDAACSFEILNAAGDTVYYVVDASIISTMGIVYSTDEICNIGCTERHATVTATACDSYTWNGETYTTSGEYTYTTIGSNGCDSTTTLILTINTTGNSTETITACDSYTWWINGVTYTETPQVAPTYTITGENCNTIFTLNLTIINSVENSFTDEVCDQYSWDGMEYTQSGSYTKIYERSNGCDSTVTLNLTVNHSVNTIVSESACESFIWNDSIYSTSGAFVRTLTNSHGCDSTVIMALTINQPKNKTIVVTACDSYSWNNQTYLASGNYTDTTIGSNGCDSITTLQLTINTADTSTETITACDNYTWINGVTYTETPLVAPTHTVTGDNCSTVVILDLTINNHTEESITEEDCDYHIWDGSYYENSGSYIKTFDGSNGCDSIVTLSLTINQSVNNTITETGCGSYNWNGIIYNASGAYNQNLTTSHGCDSTVTMILVINQPKSTSIVATACDSYTWNGQSYTTSGDYTYITTGSNGCDSTVTLTLTINNSYLLEIDSTAENSLTWHGATYTESGTYSWIGTTVTGCDSVETIHITITTNQGIANVAGQKLTLTPNPASTLVHIGGIEAGATVSIFDLSGRQMFSRTASSDSMTIDVSHMAHGAYFVRMVGTKNTVTRKLVVR